MLHDGRRVRKTRLLDLAREQSRADRDHEGRNPERKPDEEEGEAAKEPVRRVEHRVEPFGVVGPDPFALLRTDEGLRASFALGRHHPQAKRLFGVRLEKSRRVEAVGERRDFTVRRLSE